MTGTNASSAGSKAMLVGIALVAAGGLISMCGVAISCTVLAASARRWVLAQQEPPSAIVRRKVAQVKAATAAGADAWQNGMTTAAQPQ
jgi:hypothetical protein